MESLLLRRCHSRTLHTVVVESNDESSQSLIFAVHVVDGKDSTSLQLVGWPRGAVGDILERLRKEPH